MGHLRGAQNRGLQTPRRRSGHFWGCPVLGLPHPGPRVPSCQVRAPTYPGGPCLPPLQSLCPLRSWSPVSPASALAAG